MLTVWLLSVAGLALGAEAALVAPMGPVQARIVMAEGSWGDLALALGVLFALCIWVDDAAGPSQVPGWGISPSRGAGIGLAGALGVYALGIGAMLRAPGSPMAVGLAAAGGVAALAVLSSLALSALAGPLRVRALQLFALALAAGPVVGLGIRLLPSAMTRLTLGVVDRVLAAVVPHNVDDLANRVVGTAGFAVRILEGCSGSEGVLLGVGLLIPYLWTGRARLRFPRALLLFPIVAASMAAANILRILALLALGQDHAVLAMSGFHSSVGWFLFAGTLGVAIPTAERALGLRTRPLGERIDDGNTRETRRLLLPLVVSLAASLLGTMAGLGQTSGAMVRYGAAVLASAVIGLPSGLRSRTGVGPWGVGLGLGALWVLITARGGEIVPAWAPLRALGYVLVTPAIEELAFRGFLMRRLAGRDIGAVDLGQISWGPMVLSSVVFGAMHAHPSLAGAAGLVFALAARRWGLSGAVAAHLCANAAIALYAFATGDWGVLG